MEVVIWSLVVVAVSTLIAQILRRTMKQVLAEKVFKIFDECLAALQCSVAIMECGVISGVFGPWSFVSLLSVFIFGVIKHSTFMRGKYVGNPVCFIDRYYAAGKKPVDSPVFIASNIGAQLVGSLLAHPLSKLFWGKTYSEHHNRVMLVECKTTLEVTFMQGMMVEFFTTFVAWMTDSMTPLNWKPPVRSAVSLALVLTFLKTSGAWMNPAMATAHTINCKGHDNHGEHFITYWLGPFMASILFNEMKEFFALVKEKRETSKDAKLGAVEFQESEPEEKKAIDLPQSNGIHEQLPANAVQKKNESLSQTKYHRSPGGSLRQRISSLGPG